MKLSFETLENDYYHAWYSEKDSETAITLAEKAMDHFPEHYEQIMLDLIVFYGESDKETLCKKMIHEGFALGYWYPLVFMNKFIHKPEYQNELETWKEFESKALLLSKAVVKVEKPFNYSPTKALPLLVSLHGWGEDLSLFSRFWHSDIIKESYIHVMIQSSQQVGYKHYCWTDREKAFQEVESVIKKLKGQYAIGNIIFGGFSEGATLSIDLAFNSKLKSVGFIALNPERPKELSDDAIKKQIHSLMGAIITGDQDQCYTEQLALCKTFTDYDFKCLFHVENGLGHWFPNTLPELIKTAIDFII